MADGWQGWDEYAPFYDWENARTVARRDVRFWRRLAGAQSGPVVELGCGTGRIMLPLVRDGLRVIGIDRSQPMLDRASHRLRGAKLTSGTLVRGDIRALPFRRRKGCRVVIAPYGILQSLTRERDLAATHQSAADLLPRGGMLAMDLVPDLPRWDEYERRTSLTGQHGRGGTLTLVESVRQDVAKGLTIFDHEYVHRKGSRREVHRFSLTFRTLSVPQMQRRLERAGFRIEATHGDYVGGPWHPSSDVWIIIARKH
jgi:SAM-dependent methyltransferase